MDNQAYLYERIYGELADEINSGARRPGEKMPTELELARDYGVSRITSKRALNLLAEQGLVVRRRGLGTFVAQRDEKERPITARAPLPRRDEQQSKRIGLIMEDLGESYALGLFYEIDRIATAMGYQICLAISYGDQRNEREALHRVLSLGLAGVIVMPAHGPYYDTDLLRLVLNHFPVVLIDRPLLGIPAPSVYSDNRGGASMLTQYLIGKGHRSIAFVSADISEAISLEDRYAGYEDAMAAAGLTPAPTLIIPKLARFGLSTGTVMAEHMQDEDGVYKWLQEYPEVTAVIGSEYGIAHMTRLAAQKLRRKIPGDLAICCFDAKYGYLGEYDFTHIRQDEAAIAQNALEVMAAILAGNNMRRQTRLIPTKLMEGGST